MSAEQSAQSRTEQPTPKKLLDSRKKGQVARSRELNTTVMMVAAAIALLALGNGIGNALKELLAADLRVDRSAAFDTKLLLIEFSSTSLEALWILLPFFLMMMLTVFIGPLVLGGWSFTMTAWQPKFSRLSPLAGLKRMFGVQGFVEMMKALGKFVVIGLVALVAVRFYQDRILTLGTLPTREGIQIGMYVIGQIFLMLAFSLILVSFIDVPYQVVSHINRLKMSIQEIRDESKQTNGNPELKGRIRALQREVSQRRMLQDVAEADVVVVNPTHYSVALKYDADVAGAPVVVAKGVDFMAMRIREVAKGNEVTIFSAPPLARALHKHTEIGQEVPAALYQAVAQVLAYVFQLRQATSVERGSIKKPADLEIPDEFMTRDEDIDRGEP